VTLNTVLQELQDLVEHELLETRTI
jgi:hypothetical protein